MLRWLLLLVGVAAVAIGFGREQLAPYLPARLSSMLGASSAGQTGAGHGGQGSGVAPTAVEVATAENGSLPILRDTIGTIIPVASTPISSEETGTVTAVAVSDGATVRRGDLLVSLDDRAAQAQIAKDEAAIARDQVTLDQAQRDLQRAQALVKSGTVDAQQGDDANSAAQTAAAVLQVDQATLAADRVTLDKLRIVAPFDGRLGAFQVSAGALVTPGTVMVTLTQTTPVHAAFTLSEADLPLLQDGLAKGTLRVTVRPAGDQSQAVTGTVDFIDNTVDSASGTIALRAAIDNPDGRLVANQSFSATVEAGTKTGLVIVPTVAVQPRQDGSVVYVVGGDATVSIRKVEVAVRVGDRTGLSSGLAAGERVVTEGQGALADGAKVNPQEAAKPAAEASSKGEATTAQAEGTAR